jgi:chromatin segregation and condensation protein Rec8/ScpA/Scc1 (kleisin family)
MEAHKNKYEVKLEIFEGPLDLLVYLVQKSELNPKDIPIAVITDQYLEFMEKIGIDNLSHAGEFLVMASRLMWLKAQELLPVDAKDEIQELEFEQNKEELFKQMLEHQKFKETAKYFKHLEMRNYGTYLRGFKEKSLLEKKSNYDFGLEAEIYDLLTAFSGAIKNQKEICIHEIEIDDVTIENQIEKVQNRLKREPHFHFEEIFKDDPRKIVIVVSFMSLLELCKLDEIRIRQYDQMGPIWIYRRKEQKLSFPDMEPAAIELSEPGTFKPGLVKYIKEELKKRKQESSLERMFGELEFLKNHQAEGQPDPALSRQ